MDEAPDPAFGFELFLQQELDTLAVSHPDIRNAVTVNRVLELYRAALVTDSVDVGASLAEWIQLLNGPSRRFFALTSAGVFRALVPRDALLAASSARWCALRIPGTTLPEPTSAEPALPRCAPGDRQGLVDARRSS